jgi:hypothetical protein
VANAYFFVAWEADEPVDDLITKHKISVETILAIRTLSNGEALEQKQTSASKVMSFIRVLKGWLVEEGGKYM